MSGVHSAISDKARALLLHRGVDPDEFAAAIAWPLLAYRGHMRAQELTPRLADEAGVAERLRDLCESLEATLTAEAGSPRLRMELRNALARAGVSWLEVRDRMMLDARAMQVVLRSALPVVGRGDRRGRKPELPERAELVKCAQDEVQRQLEGTKREAAAIALDALRACGVAVPASEQARPDGAVRKATKRRAMEQK